MTVADSLRDLGEHLGRVSGLPEAAVSRVLEEVVAYFSETLDEFVIRRHRELQHEQLRNEAIYEQIIAEVQGRRFAAPPLSPRQIRRLIYG